jgi:hypothetical protein
MTPPKVRRWLAVTLVVPSWMMLFTLTLLIGALAGAWLR